MDKIIAYTLYHNPIIHESCAYVVSRYKTAEEAEQEKDKARINDFLNGNGIYSNKHWLDNETEEDRLKEYDDFHYWFVLEEDISWIREFIK